MKIRVTGTKEECELARQYYSRLEQDPNVKYVSVSRDYPNSGSRSLFRVYIDIEYRSETEALQKLLKGAS